MKKKSEAIPILTGFVCMVLAGVCWAQQGNNGYVCTNYTQGNCLNTGCVHATPGTCSGQNNPYNTIQQIPRYYGQCKYDGVSDCVTTAVPYCSIYYYNSPSGHPDCDQQYLVCIGALNTWGC